MSLFSKFKASLLKKIFHSNRFLAMFPLNLPPGCEVLEICLDRVAQQLGIVKRRIYDIINILESLQMASKVKTHETNIYIAYLYSIF